MKRAFVAAALCSLAGLPLACRVDSDDSGSAGSSGEADSAGTGGVGGSRAGTGGGSGKGGTAGATGGQGGSTAGKAGQGGSPSGGNAGNAAGGGQGGAPDSEAGAGGDESAGSGGEAGETGDGPKATSGFDASADGWTITGDAQASSVEPDYSGVGGNPDGLISADDDVTGGTWYFTAPNKYLGDASRFYGRALKFDVKVTAISSPFDAPDVLLVGGGLTAAFDTSPDPGTDWTTFTVPLTEAGWTLTDLDGAAVTAEQFQTILADLTSLRIRGEFNDGADTGSLDNVKFGISQ